MIDTIIHGDRNEDYDRLLHELANQVEDTRVWDLVMNRVKPLKSPKMIIVSATPFNSDSWVYRQYVERLCPTEFYKEPLSD